MSNVNANKLVTDLLSGKYSIPLLEKKYGGKEACKPLWKEVLTTHQNDIVYGICLYLPRGDKVQDKEASKKLFEKNVANKNLKNMRQAIEYFWLGQYYYDKKDYINAAFNFQNAADQDYPIACYMLGKSYIEGRGVTQNTDKGNDLINKAEKLGFDGEANTMAAKEEKEAENAASKAKANANAASKAKANANAASKAKAAAAKEKENANFTELLLRESRLHAQRLEAKEQAAKAQVARPAIPIPNIPSTGRRGAVVNAPPSIAEKITKSEAEELEEFKAKRRAELEKLKKPSFWSSWFGGKRRTHRKRKQRTHRKRALRKHTRRH